MVALQLLNSSKVGKINVDIEVVPGKRDLEITINLFNI